MDIPGRNMGEAALKRDGNSDRDDFWRDAHCLNVCVEHQPANAGLYRGICDFARATRGGILSFDGARPVPPDDPVAPAIIRISCGRGWLSQRCHVIERAATDAADAAAESADLLAVHSLFRGHCHWANVWSRRGSRPYWVVPHGCLDPAGLARHSALKNLWMWRYGQQFFAESDAMIFATRRELAKAEPWLPATRSRKAGQAERQRRLVIPWPVEVPSLTGADIARTAMRDRLEIPHDDRILLWVGRFHTSKRLLQAIQAYAEANPPGCHMVIIGVDETMTRTEVRSSIPERLMARIHVLGELRGTALAEAWLAADGYISLSAKENFGYTAADALAHGLPVILSRGHDLAYELPGVAEGKFPYGWLLPDDATQTAAEAIKEWGESLSKESGASLRCSRLRESQREWVADHLSVDRFRNSLQDLAAASL